METSLMSSRYPFGVLYPGGARVCVQSGKEGETEGSMKV